MHPADSEVETALQDRSIFPNQTEMGRLCQQMDWSDTPLGPVSDWPHSLKTAVGMVLRQGIAQNLCWGGELIQIYNDAYRVIMGGKHPEGLGRSVLFSWEEIAGEIAPLMDRVMAGETVYFEDMLLRVRRSGSLEDAYFTFSYSPVIVESGEVGGVLINCYETTEQVRATSLQQERDQLFSELQVERARLEYVFQQAPTFLAVLRGPTHVFHLVNDAYLQLVGHREILGQPVRKALPEVVDQGFIQLLDGVLETGEPFLARELPVRLARKPGAPPEQRFIDLTYLPLNEVDGTRSGIIAHGMDVTEPVIARREVERLLRESEIERSEAESARGEAEAARAEAESARMEAEDANRAKADFLASMSHELRTPLNAIGGYVDLIEMGIHGPVTPAQEVALGRVRVSQQHLLRLINDVLAFAKLEAGQIDVRVNRLPACDLLSNVEPLLAPQAKAAEIELSIGPCDRSLVVLGDEERVLQILLNLVGNAIKFTPPGGQVQLACDRRPDGIYFSVADDGPGIEPEKQRTIFDPFVQINRRLSNPGDGIGLGLAISRDLARAMNGEIILESTPGEGSVFSLRLSAPVGAEEEVGTTPDHPPGAPGRQP
jgi:signal transduction histidine kinase